MLIGEKIGHFFELLKIFANLIIFFDILINYKYRYRTQPSSPSKTYQKEWALYDVTKIQLSYTSNKNWKSNRDLPKVEGYLKLHEGLVRPKLI